MFDLEMVTVSLAIINKWLHLGKARSDCACPESIRVDGHRTTIKTSVSLPIPHNGCHTAL